MKFKKQKIQIVLLSLLSVIVFLIIVSAIFYKPIVRYGIQYTLNKAEKKFGLQITTSAINIHSPVDYTIIGFSIHSTTDESVFVNMDSINIAFSLWSIITFSPELSKFQCFQGTIQLHDIANLKKKIQKYNIKNEDVTELKKTDYLEVTNRYLTLLQHKLPKDLLMNKVDIYALYQHRRLKIEIDTLVLQHQKIVALTKFKLNDVVSKWKFEGVVPDTENGKYEGKITALQSSLTPFPLLSFFTSSSIEFTSFTFTADVLTINSSQKQILCNINSPQNRLFNTALSSAKIPVNKFLLTLKLSLYPHKIELDSTSTVSVNGLTLSPYVLIDNKDDFLVTFKFMRQQISAQKLVNALPDNIFTTLTGLELSGNFLFDFYFFCNFNALNSLQFDYTFTPRNVTVLSTGTSIFARNTYLFAHPVKIKNLDGTYYYRPLFLDYRSSNFLLMEQIPRYVVSSILTREDPTFFTHKGIMKSAIQEALIVDIQKRKFIRGASTISMQWVKNVYLDNEKNICRKLEELLLVSLIEQLQWVSKNRIFEMYVNLIEWAPNIYGLYDAAVFYFGKTPQQLTLAESLFLALTIPSPGKFYKNFDSNGNYKPEQQERIRSTAKLMLSRNLISIMEYEKLNTNIQIKVKPEEMKNLPVMDEEENLID